MAAEEQEDLSKLSTEELIVHKSWKARVKGYEDALKIFAKATSEKDPVFNKYLGLVKNFVSDSNQVALEKGLDAAYSFVENASVSPKTAGEVCPLIVQKCLGLPKQKLREKAQDILLMYIEVEKPDVVVEALLEGLQNKNPKLVSAVLVTFTTAINQFGPKAINVKQLIKQIGPMMEHRDGDVRAKTKALAVEFYRWIGNALKPQLQTLTPLQHNELEAEFANVGTEKPSPARYLRSQKPKESEQVETDAQAAGDTADGGQASAANAAPAEMDPWEFLTPFDLMSKFPANFYEQLESKKWNERKEKLDELEKLLSDNPRLDTNGTYGELVSVLKKVIGKDSNINVVAVAGKCMAGLASGLRKKFGNYATMVAPAVLEKFKEKKPVVATAMIECIDAIAKTTTLDALTEELLSALDSKTPSVKVQTAAFLSRYFAACSSTILNKKVLKTFCPALMKLLSDPDADVREAASLVLGTAMKVVGEKTILPFLDEVTNDHLKMDKIKACCEKAEVKATIFAGSGDTSSAQQLATKEEAAKPRAGTAKPPPSTRPKQEPQGNDEQPSATAPKKAPVAAGKGRPGTAPSNRSTSATRKPPEPIKPKKEDDGSAEGGALLDTNQKAQRFQEERSLKILKWQFTTPGEEHVSQLKVQLSFVCKQFLHVQMFSPDFKQHLKALDSLIAAIELCPDAVIGALDLLLKWCTIRFFDTNPSVLLKCLSFIKAALTLCQDRGVDLHDVEVNSFVPFLLLKAGEPKDTVRADVREIIKLICKLYSASKLFPLLMEGCKSKNARQRAECLDQIAGLIEVYGISVCGQPASAALKAIAQSIGDRDNTVRNAALSAIVAAFFHLDERVFSMIGNINSKDMAMLEERIKRTVKNRPAIRKPSPERQERLKNVGATVVKPAVRPATAAPAISRSPMQYPVDNDDDSPSDTLSRSKDSRRTMDSTPRGMFQLDMDKLGLSDHKPEDYKMPELFDDADAREVLASPMQMPPLRFRPASSTTPLRREVITQSMDASSALDMAINSITSNKIDVATQALAQLDEIIKDPSKCGLLADKVDQLLMAIYFQFRMAFNTHMMDETVNRDDVIRVYRFLCIVLLSLVSVGDLVKEASEGILKDLICQLLTVLVDERLETVTEGPQIIRSLNVLLVKLVEKSDPTSCLVALIKLLRDTLHSQTSSVKFQELVLKCIWKLSRILNQHANVLHVGRILAETHAFFIDFPSTMWKPKNDTPLRTIKTILNKLAEIYGDKVLDYVDIIDKPENSEAVMVLKKSLREFSKDTPISSNGGSGTDHDLSAGSIPAKTEGNADQRRYLTEIFKKIGSQPTSKEGLKELYEFKQRYPDVDITPWLKKSSDFFRDYILRGLEQVEAEHRSRAPASKNAPNRHGSGSAPTGVPVSNISGQGAAVYLEKLQKLRATVGLEPVAVAVNVNRKFEADAESMLPELHSAAGEGNGNMDMDANGEQSNVPQPRLTADEVSDYKARLERLKRGS